MRNILIGAVALILAGGPLAAEATQIVNDDNAAYAVKIVGTDGEKVIEVAASAVVDDVCTGCTLSLGDTEVKAEDGDTVVIKGGKLEIEQ